MTCPVLVVIRTRTTRWLRPVACHTHDSIRSDHQNWDLNLEAGDREMCRWHEAAAEADVAVEDLLDREDWDSALVRITITFADRRTCLCDPVAGACVHLADYDPQGAIVESVKSQLLSRATDSSFHCQCG